MFELCITRPPPQRSNTILLPAPTDNSQLTKLTHFLLCPVRHEPSPAHSGPDQTLSPRTCEAVRANVETSHLHYAIQLWVSVPWWLIGARSISAISYKVYDDCLIIDAYCLRLQLSLHVIVQSKVILSAQLYCFSSRKRPFLPCNARFCSITLIPLELHFISTPVCPYKLTKVHESEVHKAFFLQEWSVVHLHHSVAQSVMAAFDLYRAMKPIDGSKELLCMIVSPARPEL